MSNNKFYELFSSYQYYHLIYKLNEELLANTSRELELSADNIISVLNSEVSEMKNKFEKIKIEMSEKYRLKLGDIAFHLIEIITSRDLKILVKNYDNFLNSALETVKLRDQNNYKYLYNYLNNVVNEYEKSGSSRKTSGYVVTEIYFKFQELLDNYKEWIANNFEEIDKKIFSIFIIQ